MGNTSLCATYMEIHIYEDGLALAELLNNWIFRKDGDGLPPALGQVQLYETRQKEAAEESRWR